MPLAGFDIQKRYCHVVLLLLVLESSVIATPFHVNVGEPGMLSRVRQTSKSVAPGAMAIDALQVFELFAKLEVELSKVTAIYHADAMQRHFEVCVLYMKPTVRGRVVEPFDVVGAVTVLFSVFTQVIPSATALKS